MTRRSALAFALVCSIAAVGHAQRPLDRNWNGPRKAVPRAAGAELGTGTVQYDPGAPADALLSGTGFNNNYFGNLFNTRNGSPLSPGTVTFLSWYQGVVGTANLGLPVFGPATGGPTAYVFVGSPAPYAFNGVGVNWPAPGPFFAGMAEVTQQACCINIGNGGARSASYNGQGFHAQQRGFSGYASTVVLTGQNVMARATGSVIIPVELLEFEVD